MANKITSHNSAPAAESVTVFKRLGSFAPKAALAQIAEISARIKPLEKERSTWLRPEAEAEIHRRRSAVKNDPSEANLAQMSAESAAQLSARYEATADEYHRLLTEMALSLHQPYKAVLGGLLDALDEAIAKVTAEQGKTFASWGVKYDPATDQLILSLLRLKESAVARLDSQTVMHHDDFRQFLGIKTGFFA